MVSSSIQFGSTTIQTRGLPGRTAIPFLILVSDVSGSMKNQQDRHLDGSPGAARHSNDR
jgi:uncharacterized protein with von Willebrand factor type A (vWA) domain